VIANLSIWFAMNVIFAQVDRTRFGWLPDVASLDWRALVLSLIAAILLLRLHVGLLKVLFISALLAVGVSLV
jgi:chromate transporter